jgi:YidC/Oxa1 family membrane protein insertase
MLIEIWNTILFQPLYNVLIFIYNSWTDNNLGWAVVYLTLMLRAVLLPLTVIGIISQRKNRALGDEVQQVAKRFQHDSILQKQEVRRLLKEKRVSPWAKAVSLGIQAVVVVLLYEVFLLGLEGDQLIEYLYPWVEYPGQINTMFGGMDIGENHNSVWAGAVAAWMFFETFFELRRDGEVDRKDMFFLILFPVAIYVILWILPMMKALFFMTTILFSFVVERFITLIIKPKDDTETVKGTKTA